MTLTTTEERITPKKAREYLQANVNNYRKFRRGKVEQYARSMRTNKWAVTGEAIKFDKQGNLADGQNRLAACVEAGKSFKTLVVRGVEQDAVLNMDTGSPRSFSDHLRRAEFKNVALLASALRFCWQYENDAIMARPSTSHDELFAMAVSRPELAESVNWVANHKTPFLGITKAAVVVRYYTRGLPGEFDAFWEQLKLGTNLEAGHPVHSLRRWLEWNGARTKFSPPRVCEAVFIKAWNAWIEGRQVEQLRWRIAGVGAEDFPTIVTEYPGEQGA